MLDKEITGGKVKVLVKFDLMILLDKTFGACELLEQSGEHCPVPPGTVYIRRAFSNVYVSSQRSYKYFYNSGGSFRSSWSKATYQMYMYTVSSQGRYYGSMDGNPMMCGSGVCYV